MKLIPSDVKSLVLRMIRTSKTWKQTLSFLEKRFGDEQKKVESPDMFVHALKQRWKILSRCLISAWISCCQRMNLVKDQFRKLYPSSTQKQILRNIPERIERKLSEIKCSLSVSKSMLRLAKISVSWALIVRIRLDAEFMTSIRESMSTQRKLQTRSLKMKRSWLIRRWPIITSRQFSNI